MGYNGLMLNYDITEQYRLAIGLCVPELRAWISVTERTGTKMDA
jgi:hypothetical protein